MLTSDEARLISVRAYYWPAGNYAKWSLKPCETRLDWIRYGDCMGLLAALRNDIEPSRLPSGEIYTIMGLVRAKHDVLEALKMDGRRYYSILSKNPIEIARRLRAYANSCVESEILVEICTRIVKSRKNDEQIV